MESYPINPHKLNIRSRKDKDGKYISVRLYHETGEIGASFGVEQAMKLHKFLDYFFRK